MPRPQHHRPDGRFRNPWPEAAGDDRLRRQIFRVAREWLFGNHAPDPEPHQLPEATSDIVHPRIERDELRITWIGHASFLVQLPGLNLLTDPVFSRRVSPLPFLGPKRFVPATPAFEQLPPIDAVLLSHDHYDHLDDGTVRKLHRRFGDTITWLAPLGYDGWFARRGVRRVTCCDWWQVVDLPGGAYRAHCVPARHWTRRRPLGTNRRLWCGWVVERALPAEGPGRLYFAGDSGYASVFREIGGRLGPFHVNLLPIGAYEPAWFMSAAHMNPEEAVRAFGDLGGQGAFVGMHWGTWRLTFEDPLEPKERAKRAWRAAKLSERDLHLPRRGQTLIL